MADLNDRLLAAHATGDKEALVSLYAQASDAAATPRAAAFFLTQAYVFALDSGHPMASELLARLRACGADH